MHRILLIAKRDYLMSVRAKAFLIGLIVAPILFGGSFIGLGIMRKKPDIADRRIAVLDHTGKAAAEIIQAAEAKNKRTMFDRPGGPQTTPRYVFQAVAPDESDPKAQRLALSDRIRRKELFAFVELGANTLHPHHDDNADDSKLAPEDRVSYYSNAGGIDEARSWIGGPVNDGLRRARLAELGVNPARFEDALAAVSIQSMSLLARDERTGAVSDSHKKSELEGFAVPFIMVMLLAMIVIASAAPILGAVADDKSQRVFEMLLSSATPFELMGGKVLASLALSLTSSIFYVGGGLFVLQGMAMMGLAPLNLLPWFLAYLVADVMILSSFGMALGAACSSPHDAQQLGVVLLAPVIVPMMMMMPVMQQPNGVLATALSLFPPFTPLLMLMRQAMPGGIPAWQPWAGLLGVLACAVGISWIAARIFRVALLFQGKTPKIGELLKWAARG